MLSANTAKPPHAAHKWRLSAAAITFFIAASGCTTLAPTEPFGLTRPEERLPTQSATSPLLEASGAATVDWPLKLEDCLSIALANNPEISAAGWDAAAAQSDKHVKAAARWPSIGLTGSYFTHQDNQRLVAPFSPGAATYFTKNIVSSDIVLRLPLYAGGQLVNEVRAAELLLRAAEHSLARSRQELIFNVTSTYYSILAQQHVIASLEFSREVLLQHLEHVNNLIAAQKTVRVDALRTEVRLADLDQRLLQEKNICEIQRRFLVNQLGLEEYPPRETIIAGDLETVITEEENGIEDYIDRAYAQRQDYAAAVTLLESQAKRVDIARGEQEPTLSLEAAYGGRWGIGGSGDPAIPSSRTIAVDAQGNPSYSVTSPLRQQGALTTTQGAQGLSSLRYTPGEVDSADSFEDLGRIGVTVNVPLFEGGRIRAQIARERAKLHAAQQRLRKLGLQIRLEVETATLNLASARKRVAVTQKSIVEAEESLRIERQKYDFGKGTIVDVLDAQAELLNAQTNYYASLADTHLAYAQIAFATGEEK